MGQFAGFQFSPQGCSSEAQPVLLTFDMGYLLIAPHCPRATESLLSAPAKSKGEKERYTHLNAELQRIVRRDKKALLSDQCKEIEENNRMKKD